MKKLPAVSEMEHITSKEFGENMDAILERVAKEDVALIIDHADKSYVLCPARWFEVPELTQLEVMVKNAVRYVSEVDDSDPALCIPYCHRVIVLEMVGRCMPKDDYPALQNGESLKPHPDSEITRTFVFPAAAFV